MTRRKWIGVAKEAAEWLLCFAALYLTVAMMMMLAELAN